MFVGDSVAAYLDAELLGAPGLTDKRSELSAATPTLIVTDVAFNIERVAGWWTRGCLRMMGASGGFRQSRMVHFAIRDEQAARASFDRVLPRDFERVVVAHGEVLEHGGRDALEHACCWL